MYTYNTQQLAMVDVGNFATAKLDPNGTTADWARSSGLDFRLKESVIQYETEMGLQQMRDAKVIYRGDTLRPIAHVGKGFKPVQPVDMISFYRKLCDLGNFQVEALGVLKGGAQMWGLAKTSFETRILGQDAVDAFLFFVTGNDSSMSTKVSFLSRRIACNNMINAAYGGNFGLGEWSIKVKHTSEVNFDGMYDQMTKLPQYWETFTENAENMALKKLNQEQMIEFFVSLYGDKAESQTQMVQKKVDQLIHLAYSSPGSEFRSARGTLWGALNAVSYYTDHDCRARSAENRFSSAMTGAGNNLKKTAFSNAIELLG